MSRRAPVPCAPARRSAAAVDRVRLPPHGVLGGALRPRVERGVHDEIAELVVAEHRVDDGAHRVERERAVLARPQRAGREPERRRPCPRGGAVAQIVLAGHDGEDEVPPCQGPVRMPSRRVDRRPAGQRREGGALGHGEAVDALAEEVLARGLDAVGAVPEVDHVEVEREDLLLGERALEPVREMDLDQLAAERALLREPRDEGVPHHLHGDRAEALAHVGLAQVPDEGARRAPPVDSAMVVEAAVLDRDERRAHVARHPRQRHVDAPDVVEPAERGAAAVEHPSALARAEGHDLGGGRTAVEAAGEGPGARGQEEEAQQGERRQTEAAPGGKGKGQLVCGAESAGSIRAPLSVVGWPLPRRRWNLLHRASASSRTVAAASRTRSRAGAARSLVRR